MKIQKKYLCFGITLVLLLSLLTGCSSDSENEVKSKDVSVAPVSKLAAGADTFEVTSESVDNNGVLKTDCCSLEAAPKGRNLSPQLSWKMVEDATCYAVYMYDADADAFLHWRVADLTETSLKEGAMSMEAMYVGPYPPDGTHHYQITVYALKQAPQLYEGKMGAKADVAQIEKCLDEIDGTSGNVVGVGIMNCVVTRGK